MPLVGMKLHCVWKPCTLCMHYSVFSVFSCTVHCALFTIHCALWAGFDEIAGRKEGVNHRHALNTFLTSRDNLDFIDGTNKQNWIKCSSRITCLIYICRFFCSVGWNKAISWIVGWCVTSFSHHSFWYGLEGELIRLRNKLRIRFYRPDHLTTWTTWPPGPPDHLTFWPPDQSDQPDPLTTMTIWNTWTAWTN